MQGCWRLGIGYRSSLRGSGDANDDVFHAGCKPYGLPEASQTIGAFAQRMDIGARKKAPGRDMVNRMIQIKDFEDKGTTKIDEQGAKTCHRCG